jgi:protocatechuate 3,4-dioxygenase beta subunit
VRFCLRCLVLLTALVAVSPRIVAAVPGDARIVGHVICADTGQPARFATVTLQPVPAPNAKLDLDHLPSSSSTIAGDDGAYVFDSIQAGRYVIGAELQGYVSPLVTASADRLKNDDPAAFSAVFHEMTPVVVDASSTASADIRLERGAALSGTVSYDDGSPSIQATIELLRRTKDGSTHEVALSSLELLFSGMASIKSNDLGQYRVAGLPPGDYILRTSLPRPPMTFSGITVGNIRVTHTPETLSRLRLYSGNSFRMRDAKVIHVNGGEEITGLDIVFPLSTLHQVTAVLTSTSGSLPKESQVSLVYADNQEVLDTAEVDADTHMAFFGGVPEGNYLLQVKSSANQGNGHVAALSVPVQVKSDLQNVSLNLP